MTQPRQLALRTDQPDPADGLVGWAARFLAAGWDVVLPKAVPEGLEGRIDAALRIVRSLANAVEGPPGRLLSTAGQRPHPDPDGGGPQIAPQADIVICPRGDRSDCVLIEVTSVGASAGAGNVKQSPARPPLRATAQAVGPLHLLPVVELMCKDDPAPLIAMLKGVGVVCLPSCPRGDRSSVTDSSVIDSSVTGSSVTDRLRAAWAAALVDERQAGAMSASDLDRLASEGLVPALLLAELDPAERDRVGVGLMRTLDVDRDHSPQAASPSNQTPDQTKSHPPAPWQAEARVVPLSWTDYNGHMNEARYLEAFSQATDQLMGWIGCDADYVAAGQSYFTAETHIRHLDEVRAGALIRVEILVLSGQGRRMHLFQQMFEGARLLATAEQVLVHVDLTSRRASIPADHVARALAALARAHAELRRPEGIGRHVGQPRSG